MVFDLRWLGMNKFIGAARNKTVPPLSPTAHAVGRLFKYQHVGDW